jgi:hypothetical protein
VVLACVQSQFGGEEWKSSKSPAYKLHFGKIQIIFGYALKVARIEHVVAPLISSKSG